VNRLLFLVVALQCALAYSTANAAPDVLVVCPREYRAALAPWESFRRSQGHELRVVETAASVAAIQDEIRRTATGGALKHVVLVGDVSSVPTGYVDAKINIRWGSEPTIATDQVYADVDGDALPDVAVGRLPVDSAAELSAVVRKIVRYERQADDGAWRERINVVAGVGGFGPVTDMLIEAAGRSVFQQVVPASYEVTRATTNPADVPKQMEDGCFAWIYLGHGLPTELDHVPTPTGHRTILAARDAGRLRCTANAPLAVLVACYTGAIDAPSDCLAEELTVAEHGPVATIAATRVSMPYGNTVFGCELLRAAVVEREATLGEIWTRAQRQTLATAPADDQLRTSLDAMARGVSPPPVELDAERREHVMLYQLLGDPLLRPAYPKDVRVASPTNVADDMAKR
jgi:hypothetical protein